jgi:hypothetical protein
MVMKIFLNRTRRQKSLKKDEFDRLIEILEKHAPPRYREERESFYYNYRSITAYRRPLMSLLDLLSKKKDQALSDDSYAREVFGRLKDFYDPKGRISLEEAQKDINLKKKFQDLFRLFFDKKPPLGGI